MKKTTMRIVGFLLAAAALVFVTGCPQPESAKKPEVNPAPQFDYSKLKNTKWMVYSFMDTNHATIGNKGYFFVFDNTAVPELRVAYDDNTGSGTNDAKTRAQKVTYTITGLDKIAIPELNLAEAKPFVIKASDPDAENKKSLTITVGTKKIILVPTTDASNFAADSSPENVVTAFNTLTGAPKWDGATEKDKVWQVTKINTTDVTAKKLYLAFTGDAKITLAANDGTVTEKKADSESDYTLGAAVLGNSTPTISITDLTIADGKFSWSGEAGSRTAVIQATNMKVEAKECSDPNYATVNGWGTETKATIQALFAE